MLRQSDSCQGSACRNDEIQTRLFLKLASRSCQNNARIMPESCQNHARLPNSPLPSCPNAQSTQSLSHRIMPDCPTAQSTQFQLAQQPNPPNSNLPNSPTHPIPTCPTAQLLTCLSTLTLQTPPAAHLFSCSYAKDCRGMFLEKLDFTLLSSPI